jgi:hypothetical protein
MKELPKDKLAQTVRVSDDARNLGCRKWLTATQDRSRWRCLLKEANVHLGLYRADDDNENDDDDVYLYILRVLIIF